ncbi:MAG: ABC transporter ATP-binding protein [Bacteroidetes bacterium HGW-Bacteroidetes-22]|nr:MAG: ABC transporter ATP-binding protein [Bacteroidetes bacterium HGW-Bacteroidetes-22]
MLLDIIRPDSGTIRFNLDGNVRTLVGYLPEDRGLYPDLPILRTLTYFGQLRGMTTADARRSAIDWLKRAELTDRANDKLLTLSKGNQQKIQFISAIIHQPRFAILDEPFSGLDPINQEKFIDTIRELKQQGTTILLSSHQMALVEKLADRILLMNQGKSLFCGTLPEIRQRSATEGKLMVRFAEQPDQSILEATDGVTRTIMTEDGETIIEFDRMTSLNQMMSRLASLSAIVSVRSSRTDLHDIYLQLTLAATNTKHTSQ